MPTQHATSTNFYLKEKETDINATENKLSVLFLNTRSALGADVAVHMTLIQNFDPQQVDLHVATNCNSRDLQQTLDILHSAPGLNTPSIPQGKKNKRLLVLNLGQEMSRTESSKFGKIRGILSNLAVLPSLIRLAIYIKQYRIQLIHSTDRPRDALFASFLARITGCQNVMHVHIKWDASIGKAARWAVDQCAGVIAISDFTRQSILKDGIDAEKVYTCLNSCDAIRFSPEQTSCGLLRNHFQIPDDAPIIGLVARVILWKGHLELVETLPRIREHIPNVQLIIVGEEDPIIANTSDSFGTKVRIRIAELGLQSCVHWAGWQNDMPRVMRDFDVLCVPSWEEPFGLVCIEGMAMHCPVVGFNSGGLPEIFTDGIEGRLVPPKDTIELANALIELLQDPILRAEMGRKGRDRVLCDFTPRRQTDEIVDIYRKITNSKGKRGISIP